MHGFAGLRETDEELHFHPRLPAEWASMRFRLQWHGQCLEVVMARATTTYRLLEGIALRLFHDSQEVLVTDGVPSTVPTVGCPAGPRP